MNGIVSSRYEGQSLVEYAIIVALVALVIIGMLSLMGVSLAEAYCRVTTGIGFETGYCLGVDDGGSEEADGGAQDGGDGGNQETVEEEEKEEEEQKSGTIFFDDFSGDLSKWQILSGNKWNISGEKLCNGPGEHQALAIDSDYDDYTVSVDAMISSGQGYGVIVRAANPGNRLQALIFQYDPGYGQVGRFLFREWVNGYERSPIARAAPPEGFEWYGVQRHIVVHVSGSNYSAFVDGELVLTAQLDSLQSGQAGLRTWGSADVCFDNFTVTAP